MALKGITRDDDLMVITRKGIIIRTDIDKISVIGRNTQGVKIISLDENDSVIDITLCEKDQEESEISKMGENSEITEANTKDENQNP